MAEELSVAAFLDQAGLARGDIRLEGEFHRAKLTDEPIASLSFQSEADFLEAGC